MGCSVSMYFGERFVDGQFKVYKSEGLPVEIVDYDCTLLKTALGLSFDSFKLTEKELLSTASINSWLQYAASSQDNDILGVKIFKELFGIGGFDDLIAISARVLNNILEQHDASALNEILSKFAIEETAEAFIKLEQAFEWLKGIHSEFYGKKYLVQVGDQTSGVCVKDKFGNRPNFDLKVEAEGGLYYTSDMPVNAGAWPNPGQTQVLGLNIGTDTLLFQESDNRIGAFVKIAQYENLDRFGFEWEIDLSAVGDDSFTIKNGSLYLKAAVSEVLYELDGRQYVLVDLSSSPLLRLTMGVDDCQSNLLAQGAQSLMILFGDAESGDEPFKDALKNVFCDNKDGNLRGIPHNRSGFNVLNAHKPTIIPDSFVIPSKSNIFVYGPWFFQANPVGGTIVESNKDLCPWKFSNGSDDGYDRMNVYGGLIAYDGPRGLQKQESGSITVASLPSYNIGFIVGANAATLTDININIGEGGFTTTYNFQTYTPKFGSPGRQLADLWSKSYKSMSYINKFFKDQKIEIEKVVNKNRIGLQKRLGNKLNNKKFDVGEVDDENKTLLPAAKSPGFLLMSGYMFEDYEVNVSDGSGGSGSTNNNDRPCPRCDTYMYPPPLPGSSNSESGGNILQNRPRTDLDKGHTWEYVRENTYNRLAISTLDLILSPITNKQSGSEIDPLPRLALYHDGGEFADKSTAYAAGDPPRSKPTNVLPPYLYIGGILGDLPIHQQYLNAVTSQQMLNYWDTRQNGSTKGFITHLITYGTDFTDFKLSITDDDEEDRQSHDEFRYSALRGPLTLQSWGYDITGKPVPNAVDSPASCESGQFTKNGLKDEFLKNWLNNPKTWPIGPIDLRWDRERGVWVSPPANKIVIARLEEPVTPGGKGQAELLNPIAGGIRFYQNYDIWGPGGEDMKQGLNNSKIMVYDFLGVGYCKCDIVYAYYDDNRYIVLESTRAYQDNPTEPCCPDTTTTTTPPPPTQPPPPPPATIDCWCGLECLKTLSNFRPGAHQALVHKIVGSADCLAWEDIVECVEDGVAATALPSAPSVDEDSAEFVEAPGALSASSSTGVEGSSTGNFEHDGISQAQVSLGPTSMEINPFEPSRTDLGSMLTATVDTDIIDPDADPKTLGHIISWTFNSQPYNFDYLTEGEKIELQYFINIVDSQFKNLIPEPKVISVTITGTGASEPLKIEFEEPVDAAYAVPSLSVSGVLTYYGTITNSQIDEEPTRYGIIDTVTVSNIETNTNRTGPIGSSTFVRGEIPTENDLVDMLTVGVNASQDTNEAAVLNWSWKADRGDSRPALTDFNYMSEDDFFNITYDVHAEFRIDGVVEKEETRQIIIKIQGTNDAPFIIGGIPAENVLTARSCPIAGSFQEPIFINGPTITDRDLSDGDFTYTTSMNGFSVTSVLTLEEWESTDIWPSPSEWQDGLELTVTNTKDAYTETSTDHTADEQGSFSLTYTPPAGYKDWLNANDLVSIQFTVTVADERGASIDIPFRFDIQGRGDSSVWTAKLHSNSNSNQDTDGDGHNDAFFLYEDDGTNSVTTTNPHFMDITQSTTGGTVYVDIYVDDRSIGGSATTKDLYVFGYMDVFDEDYADSISAGVVSGLSTASQMGSDYRDKFEVTYPTTYQDLEQPSVRWLMNPLNSSKIHDPSAYTLRSTDDPVTDSSGTNPTVRSQRIPGEKAKPASVTSDGKGRLYWCVHFPKENYVVLKNHTAAEGDVAASLANNFRYYITPNGTCPSASSTVASSLPLAITFYSLNADSTPTLRSGSSLT